MTAIKRLSAAKRETPNHPDESSARKRPVDLISRAVRSAGSSSLRRVAGYSSPAGRVWMWQTEGSSEQHVVKIAESVVAACQKAGAPVPSVDSRRWPQGGLTLILDGVALNIAVRPKSDEPEAAADRAKRLRAETLKEAKRIFADPRRASSWLRKKNRILGNRTPLSLLDSEDGVQEVSEELGRIDHGMLS